MSEPISYNSEQLKKLGEQQVFVIDDASMLNSNENYEYLFKDARDRILIGKLSDRMWSISMKLWLKPKSGEFVADSYLPVLNEATQAKFHIEEKESSTRYTFGSTISHTTSINYYGSAIMDPQLRINFVDALQEGQEMYINVSRIIVLDEGDKMVCDL